MKNMSFALVFLLATSAPTYAQPGITGTWRVEGTGEPFPWELVLRADGPTLRGAVNSCASLVGLSEVFEGNIAGNMITFKCRSGDSQRTISFTGKITGDQIAFTWAMQVRDGGIRDPRIDGMFGSSAPPQFIANRVPDGELAKTLDKALDTVPGMNFAGAANLIPKDLKAEAALFVPRKVVRVRAVLVVFFGLGSELLVAPEWRHLAETLDAALLGVSFNGISRDVALGAMDENDRAEVLDALLQRLAQDSGHQELIDAPLLFWGHSGAAVAAASLAARLPNRALAFVRYHSGAAPGGDLTELGKIPALLLSGGKEANASNPAATETLWRRGRSAGAPWTFAVEPDASHGDPKDLATANDFMIPWITAVIRQRLSPDSNTLRPITDGTAWLGDNKTGQVAPYGTFAGSKPEANWLPDEASARAWRLVTGLAK